METNLRPIKLESNICTGSAGGDPNRYNDIDHDDDDAALTGKLENNLTRAKYNDDYSDIDIQGCFGTWVVSDT